ncbi:MAG: methyltransferase family protein [Thermoanaerobaculum sp.]
MVSGAVLLGGGLLVLAGAWSLGKALTPLPVPKLDASLRTRGPYRFMGHPMDTGGILAAWGCALLGRSWPGTLWAVVVFAFFDRKAAVEERLLLQTYPSYGSYCLAVAKFFPYLY